VRLSHYQLFSVKLGASGLPFPLDTLLQYGHIEAFFSRYGRGQQDITHVIDDATKDTFWRLVVAITWASIGTAHIGDGAVRRGSHGRRGGAHV